MFHIGHLNLLQQTGKQYDFLIVSVNSDECVQLSKNKMLIICVKERKKIVGSLEFISKTDLASSADKMEASKKYHFSKLIER